MKPTTISRRDATRNKIRNTAIKLFAKQGYSGTPLRQVAQCVGIQMASLYYHFDSKNSLLMDIMRQFSDEVYSAVKEATDREQMPVGKVRETVRIFVMFHGTRPDEAFISDSEVRSIDGDDRIYIEKQRKRFTYDLADHIQAGMDQGHFVCPSAKLSAIAILSMCAAVCTWYSPRGKLALEDIARNYANFASHMLGYNQGSQ